MADVIDRNKLKSIQLNLLSYFIDVCNKNNLRYYALGGTALGAIRHKGYIPWDDDIDVGLPRTDYNKLLSLLNNSLPNNIVLQNCFTEPDYRLPFSKLRDKNSIFREKAVANLNISHGVYIDIFPIDGFPNNKLKQQFLIFKKRLARLYAEKDYDVKRSFLKRLATFIAKIFYIGRKTSTVLTNFDKTAQKYNFDDCELSVVYGATHLKLDVFDKDVYGQGLSVKFENTTVIIPENYELYLTQKYGDYMKIPSKENQITDHHCVEINLGE